MFTLDIPILLFISWLTTAYSCPIITICKSILAILISPTDFKVVAVVNTVLSTIINLIFLASIITLIVIVLRSEVSSTYKYW
jgi:hypothetical protein